MARHTFGSTGGRVHRRVRTDTNKSTRTAEEVVREIKEGLKKPKGEDYREKSLAIHGMVCGKCGREFGSKDRRLLTVHHRDGNHQNNPPDGSNWENLCVYCHDDEHSRGVLAEYMDGEGAPEEQPLAFVDPAEGGDGGGLGALLKAALEKKGKG